MSLYTRKQRRQVQQALSQGMSGTAAERRAALRRLYQSGEHLGAQLGLDTVQGIVRTRITDYGGEAKMNPGTVVLELWGDCLLEEVMAVVDEHRGAGILVVPVLRDARWWMRAWAWARWTMRRKR